MQQLCCSRGHTWNSNDDGLGSCPVCGAMGASTTHGKFESTVGSNEAHSGPVPLVAGSGPQATQTPAGSLRASQLFEVPTREAAGNSNLTLPPPSSMPSQTSAPPVIGNDQP